VLGGVIKACDQDEAEQYMRDHLGTSLARPPLNVRGNHGHYRLLKVEEQGVEE